MGALRQAPHWAITWAQQEEVSLPLTSPAPYSQPSHRAGSSLIDSSVTAGTVWCTCALAASLGRHEQSGRRTHPRAVGADRVGQPRSRILESPAGPSRPSLTMIRSMPQNEAVRPPSCGARQWTTLVRGTSCSWNSAAY